MDGLDPHLLRKYVAAGHLPHFARFLKDGSFSLLRTTWPPQSPTAWSIFITGKNPGKHSVFDMVIRDPSNYRPLDGLTHITEPKWAPAAGDWQLPLIGSEAVCRRAGTPFWHYICDAGIPAALYKMPADFPPDDHGARIVTCLGTTDLMGRISASFAYYTDDPPPDAGSLTMPRVYSVLHGSSQVKAQLYGPQHPLKRTPESLTCPFSVGISSDRNTMLIETCGQRVLLHQGEWSPWLEVQFPYPPAPGAVQAIVRFYAKEISPHFRLYVSPLNISPVKPAMPISTPGRFAADIAREIGLYYTQGLPADFSARKMNVLNDDEYLAQADLVWQERKRLFDYAWRRFDGGLLFFYFTLSDLNSHMFWRALDPTHPSYTEELGRKYGDVILNTYRRLDAIVGQVFEGMPPNTTVIVMSDHGFGPLRRYFCVNRWLQREGLLTLKKAKTVESATDYLVDADWTRTAAYQVGYNAVYLNRRGREGKGVLDASRAEELRAKLQARLVSVVDPATGLRPISRVMRREEIYKGPYVDRAPDLVLGYHNGYRTFHALGALAAEVFTVNTEAWSGDHLVDPATVQGTLIVNRPLYSDNPGIEDIGPTICSIFGVSTGDMEGRSILGLA